MTAIELRARPVRRLEWRRVQVREVTVETSRVKSLRLQVNGWQGDLPGQDVDIPHGRGRLPGAAQLLDCLAPRGRICHFDRGASGERRGFSISRLRSFLAETNSNWGADRRLLRMDHRHRRPSLCRGRRIRCCASDGDAPSPRQAEQSHPRSAVVFIQKPRRRDLPNVMQWPAAILICKWSARSAENRRRKGRAIGVGLTRRCWPRCAFHPNVCGPTAFRGGRLELQG
jgi:hypothetical protein